MTTLDVIRANLHAWDVGQPLCPPGGYDENSYTRGPDGAQYRNDCSGYVSMLTRLHDNPYTGAMIGGRYSTPIGRDALRFGDIMIAVAGAGWDAGHVVMFDRWVDSATYLGHEFGWGAGPAHRNIAYPYDDPGAGQDSRTFTPHRLLVVQPDSPAAPTPSPGGGTYTVKAGDTLSGIALDVLGDAARYVDIAAANSIAPPYVINVGQVLKMPLTLGHTGGSSAPTPPPVRHGPMFGHPVPALIARGTGQYYGSISGPNASHGGYILSERPEIVLLQRQLIYAGYVPGVPSAQWATSGWADGIFDTPADRPGTGATSMAVSRFQHDHMPGTRFFGQVWFDDWAKLASL